MAAARRRGVLNLSGANISETSGSGPWKVHVIFRNDGKVYERTQNNSGNDTTTQIATLEDWIRPASLAGDGSGFQVRNTTTPDQTLDEVAAAVGVWVDISIDRIWGFTSSFPSDDNSGALTFEIRRLGGLVEDSGTYTFILDTS